MLPLRTARRLAGGAGPRGGEEPAPTAAPVVGDGVPDAARRPEPPLPATQGWPFGEHLPRTCGTGRMAAGSVLWTDFLYDDLGAGTRITMPPGRIVPPKGTYL